MSTLLQVLPDRESRERKQERARYVNVRTAESPPMGIPPPAFKRAKKLGGLSGRGLRAIRVGLLGLEGIDDNLAVSGRRSRRSWGGANVTAMTHVGIAILVAAQHGAAGQAACTGAERLGVRNAHALEYDSAIGQVVLFAGADQAAVKRDLWTWDGAAWTCLDASDAGPPARTFPATAYDDSRSRLIVFGGNRVLFGRPGDTNTLLADTWEWDGGRWHRITGPSPPARAEAAMAYDPERRRVVLFGGYRLASDGSIERLGDTWEWDGQSWSEQDETGPAARSGASMVFAPSAGGVVVFGGNGPRGDTWVWDGESWHRVVEKDPPGRYNSVMAFDPVRGALVRFGGWDGQMRAGGTWMLEGVEWSRLSVAGPLARNHAAAAYDERRSRWVLMGGHDGEFVFCDTWEWNGSAWHSVRPCKPIRRVSNGH